MARSSPCFLGNCRGGSGFRCDRYSHDEGAARAVFIVAAKDLSAVGANDSVADAQAQAGALGGLFGGVEGIEDAFGIWNSGAVVGDGDFDVLVTAAGVNDDMPALSSVLYRVVGVVQDVEEDLLQLLSIA